MATSKEHLEMFKALSRVFDPLYVLDSDGLGSAYVEEAHRDFREQLDAHLRLNDRAKLLVAGQPGCGKTTLLYKLSELLRTRDRRIVALINLELQTAVQDLGSAEMHLAAIAQLLREAEASGVPLSEVALDGIRQWLSSVGATEVSGCGPAALATGLEELLTTTRRDEGIRRELRASVAGRADNDPQRVLAPILKDLEKQRPVVIFDGLDKLPPPQAKDFFLRAEKKPMADAGCAAILTIPLSIVYEPTFNILAERYNNAQNAVLPAIRLYDFHSGQKQRDEVGFKLLEKIVTARVEPIGPELLGPDAARRAIEASGGNIRELARVIQASVVKTVVRQGDEIEVQDIEAAIADQRESYRRGLQDRFIAPLRAVRDTYKLNNSDDVGKLLLYGLWIIEYRNDEAWYALPVAVEALLKRIERSP